MLLSQAPRLLPPALKTVERLFGSNENAVPVDYRRGVNFFVKFVRRNYLPIRRVGDDADDALFTGKINLPVASHRRREVIAASRNTFFLQHPAARYVQFGHDAAVLDHPQN